MFYHANSAYYNSTVNNETNLLNMPARILVSKFQGQHQLLSIWCLAGKTTTPGCKLVNQPNNNTQYQYSLSHDQLWAASLTARNAVTWHRALSNVHGVTVDHQTVQCLMSDIELPTVTWRSLDIFYTVNDVFFYIVFIFFRFLGSYCKFLLNAV